MPALGNALGLPFQRRGASFVGALDAFASGLIDAFSAEYRLLSAYVGAAFCVRPSLGGADADIGYLGTGRFDASAFASHIGAGNGSAVKWYNQVSGSADWVQTSDATKQGIVTPADVNGCCSLRMDAINDGYPSIRTLNRPFTIYLVEQGLAGGVFRTLNGSSNCVLSAHRNAGNNAFIAGNVSNFNAGVTTPHVMSLVAPSGSGASYFVNGTDRTTTSTNTNNWGPLMLGHAGTTPEPANSRVLTLLVYTVSHDSTTRAAIEQILKTLHGTP